MGSEEQGPDPLIALDAELRYLLSSWVSLEFPYYVPLLKDTDGKYKVIVGRLRMDTELVYTMAAYSSLVAKNRSTLWSAGGRTESISFSRIRNVAEAYVFWYNALRKFFQTAKGLTEDDAHKLLVVFNHRDGKPFPAPICVFCYVLSLQRACKQAGITVRQETAQSELVVGEGQGGKKSPTVDAETSDTLDVDLE
jgi:hypothetical protein